METYAIRDGAYSLCAAGDLFEFVQGRSRRSLVIPTCSVGNVAQLAVDLILNSSAGARGVHVATLRHPLVLPCYGVNPYDGMDGGKPEEASSASLPDGSIRKHAAHPMDLYRLDRGDGGDGGGDGGDGGDDGDVYAIQQRAPAAAGCQVAFSRDVVAWARDAGFDVVYILGSLSAEYRKDKELNLVNGDDVMYVVCGEGESEGESEGEARCVAAGLSALGDEYRDVEEEGLHMPWAMLKAAEGRGAGAVGVLKFVLEGDNRGDAVGMAKAVASVVGVPESLFFS